MNKFSGALLAAAATLAATLAAATGALAHAMLDHAVPGVGATAPTSPKALEITFSEDIVAAFSGATLATAEGAAVAVGKATVNPANTLRVPVGQALKPGTYVVTWHVVSVDTHRSSGSYKFTIAP